MTYYSVEFKIRENGNRMTSNDYKRGEVESKTKPNDTMLEFKDYDLYRVYFNTKAEQIQFILDEVTKWQ